MNGAGPTEPMGRPSTIPMPLRKRTRRSRWLRSPSGPHLVTCCRGCSGAASRRLSDLTNEQARNAITIAQAAHDLEVPATACRSRSPPRSRSPSWSTSPAATATPADCSSSAPRPAGGAVPRSPTPVLAARAFFGQAQHTDNPGLLDIPGWQKMPLTQAAQAVQRSRLPRRLRPVGAGRRRHRRHHRRRPPDLPDDRSEHAPRRAHCRGRHRQPDHASGP